MKTEYWLQRWREGRTGWHHQDVMPLLEKHWPALHLPAGTRVLVPLCGKTLDMPWLARQGLRVLGVEVSPLAVQAFLAENNLQASRHAVGGATRYTVTNPPGVGIEIINGDVFNVPATQLAACGAFYDRAAMIALPPELRTRLACEVYAQLPAGARGLLITLDYPEGQMQGPPFSVDEVEVHRLFDARWMVELLERRDILASQPSFSANGVTALHTTVYSLTRRNH